MKQAPRFDGLPFDPFSALQWIMSKRRDLQEAAESLRRGRRQLKNAAKYYRNQMEKGRNLLHAHFAGCDSGTEERMAQLQREPICDPCDAMI